MRQNGVERFEMMQSTARGWCVLSRASAYPRLNRSSGPFENAGCVRGQDKAIRSNETPPALFKIKNLQDGERGGGFSGERERERGRGRGRWRDGEMGVGIDNIGGGVTKSDGTGKICSPSKRPLNTKRWLKIVCDAHLRRSKRRRVFIDRTSILCPGQRRRCSLMQQRQPLP